MPSTTEDKRVLTIKVKTYRIYDDVFHANVVFMVGKAPDEPNFAACIYDRECTGINAGLREYVVELKNPENFYAIVHESLHLVKRIFADRGIPFNKANHEVIAYYQEWWVRKLWKLSAKAAGLESIERQVTL